VTTHYPMRAGKVPKAKSALEESLALQIRIDGHFPAVKRQYRFHPERKWTFDFCWVEAKVAAECEGGIWLAGRHNRGAGFEKDIEKYNAATLDGWRVFRFTEGMIARGEAIITLLAALAR